MDNERRWCGFYCPISKASSNRRQGRRRWLFTGLSRLLLKHCVGRSPLDPLNACWPVLCRSYPEALPEARRGHRHSAQPFGPLSELSLLLGGRLQDQNSPRCSPSPSLRRREKKGCATRRTARLTSAVRWTALRGRRAPWASAEAAPAPRRGNSLPSRVHTQRPRLNTPRAPTALPELRSRRHGGVNGELAARPP